MSVRTYNPSVRVGNWNEDLCLEEDLLKDFIEKKEKGELLIYKANNLKSKIEEPVSLSCSEDFLHHGDRVCVYHPTSQQNLVINMKDGLLHDAETVSGPCGVSASPKLSPCYRNTFVITSASPDCAETGDFLRYGKPFMLSTLPGIGGDLKLSSDRATFMKSAKKSRLNDVSLQSIANHSCQWEILHYDPQRRLETESQPVPANALVNINHCKTNERLAALPEYKFRTPFGWENEVVANTFLDSHKAEKPENHWKLMTSLPDASDTGN